MGFELTTLGDDFANDLKRRGRYAIFYFNGDESASLDVLLRLNINERLKIITHFLVNNSKTESYMKSSDVVTRINEEFLIPVTSIRRSIQEMVKLGILIKQEVMVNGVLSSKSACYTIPKRQEILNLLAKSTLNKKNNGGDTSEDLKSVLTAVANKGLSIDDLDARNFLQKGLLFDPDIIATQYLSIAPEKRNGNSYAKAEFNHIIGDNNAGKYAIEATAHDQVVTAPAILTLMALINLSIAYNAKMYKTERYKVPFENKVVPIRLQDILYVKGLKDSGQARERIRNHIQELRETIYNWTDLTGIKDTMMQDMFSHKDFQFISSLETNSTIAPSRTATGRIKRNPTLFFIQFHDTLIEKLSKKRLFFALPSKIVMDDPLLFTFYLVLRSQNRTTDSILLKDISDQMYYVSSTNKLHGLLKARLDESYVADSSVLDNEKGAFTYNLCGYYIKFSVNQDGDRTIYVHCDHQEMIISSGAHYNPRLQDKNAPTLPNPLYIEASTVEEIQLKEAAKTIVVTLTQLYMDESTKRALQYRSLHIGDRVLDITIYTSESNLEDMATYASAIFNAPEDVIDRSLQIIKDSLKPLGYGEFMIDERTFNDMLSYLKTHHQITLQPIELINLTKLFRLSNMQRWFNGDYEHISKEVIKRINQ